MDLAMPAERAAFRQAQKIVFTEIGWPRRAPGKSHSAGRWPEGASFAAMVGNIPRAYMRAQIMSASDTESWHWQLPDVKEGETISFRMVEAAPGTGVPPESVQQRDPEEIAETKRRAEEAFDEAMKEREAEDQSRKG
jgi:hypothetical protein